MFVGIVVIACVSIDIIAAILMGVETIKVARIDMDWLILVIKVKPQIVFENEKITARFKEQRRWIKEEQEEEGRGMLLRVVDLVGLATIMQVVASVFCPNN